MLTLYIASVFVAFATTLISVKVTKDEATVRDILAVFALCAVPLFNIAISIMALYFMYISTEFSKKVRVVLDKRVF